MSSFSGLSLRHQLEHASRRVVGEDIQRAIGPLPHVTDALPLRRQIGQQALLVDDAFTLDGQPGRRPRCRTVRRLITIPLAGPPHLWSGPRVMADELAFQAPGKALV